MMKNFLLLSLMAISLFFMAQQPQRPVGVNMTGLGAGNTHRIFTDAFLQNGPWIYKYANSNNPEPGATLPTLGANGYPVSVSSGGVGVVSYLFRDVGSSFENGQYRLIVTGKGKVKIIGGGFSGSFVTPVNTLVNLSQHAGTTGVAVQFTESDASDPISSIKFIRPNYINSYQTKKFTDEFLAFMSDFQVIRYMDFTKTNSSTVNTWDSRGKEDFYNQSVKGAAWEYVADMANATGKDIWINVPERADDNYITQLGKLMQQRLNPSIKIYLEYTNEAWNGSAGFTASNWCTTQAQALGYNYSVEPRFGYIEQARKYYAKRSADVFRIFEAELSNKTRLVKVLGIQSGAAYWDTMMLNAFNSSTYNPNAVKASAIATAPYFGNTVADDLWVEGVAATITVPQIVQRMSSSMASTFQNMGTDKNLASQYQLPLIAYEGGAHIWARTTNPDASFQEKLNQANRHPDLQAVYCNYLNQWYTTVGNLFVHYKSILRNGNNGRWGLKEFEDDNNNPKYLAMKNCVFAYNSGVLGAQNSSIDAKKFSVYPNPADKTVFFRNIEKNETVYFYDVSGKLVLQTKGESADISQLSPGVYIIKSSSGSAKLMVK